MSACLLELSSVGFLIYRRKSYSIKTIVTEAAFLSAVPLAAPTGPAHVYSDKFPLIPVTMKRFGICGVWLYLTRALCQTL